jgi:Ala-tRNA(Pro) deacylase
MDENEKKFYDILEKAGIDDYKVCEHDAIFSADDADEKGIRMEGLNLKNLLIKDKKVGDYYMVIIDDHRHMDAKHFKEVAGWTKTRFANEEEMWQLLRLKPGSVTPFALFNDTEKKITVVLEKQIADAADDEQVNFHPCRNTATLGMKKSDFMKYLELMGNKVILEEYEEQGADA